MSGPERRKGLFLCLDGLDGAGKSTQVRLLADWLQRGGQEVVVCRDPGGTAIGDRIRAILLDSRSRMNTTCEMLLYMASRAQLVEEVIRPALEKERIVLSDRFLLSTIVYQGYAGGWDVEEIRRMGMAATGGLLPDWTGVLDLDPASAKGRRKEPPDRIESRPSDFHSKVRAGFLTEATRDPLHVQVIDAARSQDDVHERIRKEVERVLDSARRA